MARRTDIIEALVGHLGTNTDVHANNYQNQILNLLKSGDYQISFDAKGNPTIIPTTK